MDVALVAVAVRLVGVVPLRRPAYALLTAGLCSLLVADTIYGVLNSAGTFETGGFADLFWLGFYVLVGAAALQPAVPRLRAIEEPLEGAARGPAGDAVPRSPSLFRRSTCCGADRQTRPSRP